MRESESQRRRRWITLGEMIALGALIVSAFGVWISWKSSDHEGPTRVVEQKQPIPLTLRGVGQSDGRQITISPVEQSHALESLTITIKGASPIDVGADGRLQASDVEGALRGREKELKDHAYSVPVHIDARYVENGTDRRGTGNYVLRYRWEGEGLFGGRSLHLMSLSRG
jgi:hypothetical protein